MNKLEKLFQKGKAFIPFITAGDPSLDITKKLVLKIGEAGADLIELGIPFSDPVAEGPVIQAANLRAMANRTTVDKIFHMVRDVRKTSNVPIAFMTYANPVFAYGSQKFLKKCSRAGVDALIVPDLPFEEKEELAPYCREQGVTLVSMVAPTSKERIGKIAKEAEGFIYCVSSMGVTGVRQNIHTHVEKMVEAIKGVKDIPCAVGFGISSPDQARTMARFADGVIVGSAIVKIIEECGHECVPYVVEYVKRMREAL